MNRPRLTYFDAPISRGEECRLALHLAGVDFEDKRLKMAQWPEYKSQTPYGSIPMYEIPGKPPLAHSNAILVLIGRQHHLHPKDDFEAAQHEAMMAHVEDMRAVLGPTIRMADAEKKVAREAIAANYLPAWGEAAERNIAKGPFFAGASIQVVDLKIYMTVKWVLGGKLDHVPTSVFHPFVKLRGVYEAVHADARIKAWYEKPALPV
jgi:prostaglandin-H2 D-isomerase / glutathione transferase